jgi:deoxyadenosine/deoxycytidine kinase
MVIAIEGNIGAGKTTTAQLVATDLGADLVLEQTQAHPFLSAFYDDPGRFALETELGFVLLHYHQLHPVAHNRLVVTDFSAAKDVAFARMNLAGDQLALFNHMYKHLSGRLPKPAVAVLLDLELDESLRRIQLRGRPYELGITKDYLARLRDAYDEIFDGLAMEVRRVQLLSSDSRDVVARKVLDEVRSSRALQFQS